MTPRSPCTCFRLAEKAQDRTVTVKRATELAVSINQLLPGAAVSIRMTSTRPVVVARTSTFGPGGYGLTTRVGETSTARTCVFAEGTTVNRFETYLTIANPSAAPAHVRAHSFGSGGSQIGSMVTTVAPRRRVTVRLNNFLNNITSIASIVASDVPIVVERPEYFGSPNSSGIPGSDVFGLRGTSTQWSFPGGETSGKSAFILLFNPGGKSIPVRITAYQSNGRPQTYAVTLRPHARGTYEIGRIFKGLSSARGETVRSTNGAGFVAEQTVFVPNHSTLRTTQGLVQ